MTHPLYIANCADIIYSAEQMHLFWPMFSPFDGTRIYIYPRDHNPPHFHAYYLAAK
ncbi:DUF4160 domain-containing protein [Spirosoma agri]|uniref:DUF4160 domain-containing protein n=1 Tax=Spirosoma agri TaxID=1987381 RepID=A0A6M0INR6_9BACT|nr:DUF4160 domain-containing protein [Spirosoma agri]